MKHTAIISFFCLVGLLSSCGGTVTKHNDTADGETEETVAETTEPVFSLPEKDFGGATVNMYVWNDKQRFCISESTGDVIDDAVYARNRKVQDMYNVVFQYDLRPGYKTGEYDEWFSKLSASIMAGDNDIQLAGGYSYRMAAQTINAGFQNLKDNQYIDFSQPWWPSNCIEACDLGGNIYMAFGGIDPIYYDQTYAILYNKAIAAEHQIGDLYVLVEEGEWTLDRMIEYASLATRDLNGDSVMDTSLDKNADRFGLIQCWNMGTDAYLKAFQVPITEHDKDGLPVLVGLTEKYVDVYQKLNEFFKKSGNVLYGTNDYLKDFFMNGQGLFYTGPIGDTHKLRAMKDDFGILPYPKWNAEQDGYYAYDAIGDTTGFVVPVTADGDMMGCILEALAYYGYYDILPEYYERALKGKNARDDASEAMLDIIFDNVQFEFTEIYSFAFGNQKSPSMLLRMSMKSNTELTSLYASDENIYTSTMTSLIEALK